jgi:thiol:disulfide interchange protein DsbG
MSNRFSHALASLRGFFLFRCGSSIIRRTSPRGTQREPYFISPAPGRMHGTAPETIPHFGRVLKALLPGHPGHADAAQAHGMQPVFPPGVCVPRVSTVRARVYSRFAKPFSRLALISIMPTNTVIRAAAAATAFLSAALLLPNQAHAQFVSKPEYRALFSELEKADVVVEGAKNAKRVIFVFFDANCFYCHLTWKALQPYEKAGLQVRWVPVAYQQDSSWGRGAAIMQARDRAAALRENELNYDVKNSNGGIKPLEKPRETLVGAMRVNNKLLDRSCLRGTPALLWKDSKGDVQCKGGTPRLSELPAITGLAEQKIDDPELAEFR